MFKIYILFILLLSIFPLYFGKNFGATSMAIGILFFSFIIYIFSFKYWNRLFYMKTKFALLIILFFIHTFVNVLINENLLNIKAYLSLISLFFVFGAAYLASYSLINSKNLDLYKSIKYTFLIFTIFGIYHILVIGGPHNPFPFSEASHYALFFGPFSVLLYALSTSKTLKIFIVFLLILLGVLFPNTTILTYAFLIFLLHIKLNIKNIILISLGGIIFINIIFNNIYFYKRIFFWNEQSSENLSSLVYLQGVQDAYYSLISTSGLGLGFQQLGTQEPSEAGIVIQNLMGNDTGLNRQDGGFTAAKIIAELGFLGLFLLALYFILFKKAFFYLSNYMHGKRYDLKLAISYGFIYSFLIELFVRGAGYFTQGSFLFFVAISYLFIRKSFETPNNPQ